MTHSLAYNIQHAFQGWIIWSLIAAVFLRAAAHYALRLDIPFKTAFGASLLSYLFYAVLLLATFFIVAITPPLIARWSTMNVVALVLGALATMYGYGFVIKTQDNKPIGFRQGIRLHLFQLAIGFGLVAIMIFAVYWIIRLGGALT